MAADPRQSRYGAALAPEAGADWGSARDVGVEIARALHHDVAQDLFVARMTLFELARRLDESSHDQQLAQAALERVGSALRRTRDLVDGLHASHEASEPDLAPALRRELVDFAARTAIAVSYAESGTPSAMPQVAVGNVLAIVREALDNAWKHAHASEVRLRARHRPGWTRLTVADDGSGFRTTPVGEVEVGFGSGLAEMHERARSIGGWIALRSAPGSGTTLTISFPCRGPLDDAG